MSLRLAAFVLFFSIARMAAADWKAGAELPLKTEHLPSAARVFLPENWDAAKKWPTVFFYPGTAGEASTALIREHTGGRDFIVVGMPSRDNGAFSYTPATLALEQTTLHEIRDRLAAEVKLDPARVFVAGFSKGGWMSSLLLAHESGLAGGCILGGGWVVPQHVPPRKPSVPLYVYIGAGRLDGNFPPSLRASREFASLGARVTFEAWPDTRHAMPQGESESLRQWFSLLANGAAVNDAAAQWAEAELARIATIGVSVEQWSALRRLGARPYSRALGAKWQTQIDVCISELVKNPAVAAEAALDAELSAISQREIQDMRVTTLEAVGPRYEALAAQAPDSPTGRLAAHDAARIKRLWETVPGGKK